jgi:hypothetical protein
LEIQRSGITLGEFRKQSEEQTGLRLPQIFLKQHLG